MLYRIFLFNNRSYIKTYFCGICKITFDIISHHKSHIKTIINYLNLSLSNLTIKIFSV